MSHTKGWGIEEEKLEYQLDGQVASGAMSELQAQQMLPGYEYPGLTPAEIRQLEEKYDREYDQEAEASR